LDEIGGTVPDLRRRARGGRIGGCTDGLDRVDDHKTFGIRFDGFHHVFDGRGVEKADVGIVFGGKAPDAGGYLSRIFFRTDVDNRYLGVDSELGKEGGFADTGLSGQKINAAFGKPGSENAVELTDAGGKGVAGLGGKSGFDRETIGRFESDFLTRFGPGCFEKRSGFDEGIPLVAGGALTGPLGKLVATAVTEKDGGWFGHLR